MKSAWFVAGLAWRRLRRRDGGVAVTALGLVVATAVLAGVLAGVTIATDRSTAQAIERIPTAQRSVRAVWFGVPAGASERLRVLDGEVGKGLSGIGLPGPVPLLLFRESTVAGHFVGITAVDGVASQVVLRSGRLPHRCTPARCEVLRLRGRGALPNSPGLRLVQVGTATLRSGSSSATSSAQRTPRPSMRRVPLRSSARGGITGRRRRRSSSPRAARRSSGPLRSRGPTGRTRGCGRSLRESRGSGTSTASCAAASAHASSSPIARPRSRRRSGRGAAGGPAVRDRRRAATAAGRRRGSRPSARVHRASRSKHAARPRRGPAQARLVRSTPVAALAAQRDRERRRRGRRRPRRLARRDPRWRRRRSARRSSVADVLRESVLSKGGLALALGAALLAAGLVWLTVSLTREGAASAPSISSPSPRCSSRRLPSRAGRRRRRLRSVGLGVLLLLLPSLVAIAAAIVVARVFPVLSRWWPTGEAVGVAPGLRPSGSAAARGQPLRRSRS